MEITKELNETESLKKSKSSIGLKIKNLMDLNNISLSKIASSTGLTSEAIRQIINGTIKNPGIETLTKIANSFSVSLFELLDNRNVSSYINKKRIKIIDMFDLQKLIHDHSIDEIIQQSNISTEIMYIEDEAINSTSFAIEVNGVLADKLNTCGMPMLKHGDLLIFIKSSNLSIHTLILAKFNENTLALGVILEIENKHLWVKSVDIPQKQVVIKILKENVIGIINNVQFSK